MMGRLWGPSIPLSPTQHSAGEAFQTHPLASRTPGPRAFPSEVVGGDAGSAVPASCLQGRFGPSRAGGRCGVGVGGIWELCCPGRLLSPVTLLLRALSFVAYNQVLSHRNCDRRGLTERLLVLFCSHPMVTEMLR